MLKIKSNTNNFTIIFSEKIGKKKNAQKILFSLCLVQHPFFFSPSFLLVLVSFLFFCFCFQRPSLFLFSASFCFFSSCLSFLFSSRVPFFQPKNIFFSPKHFCVSPKPFSIQPKTFFFFQRLLLFFSLALFIQDPIFSLAASHLFYLNKSLFSSNLE